MLFLAIKKIFLAFGLFVRRLVLCVMLHILSLKKYCPSLAAQSFQLSKVLKLQIPLIWPQSVLASGFELENF